MEQVAEVYKDKFVAFLDVLGFSKHVEASEAGTGLPPDELFKIAAMLGAPDLKKRCIENGHPVCPHSRAVARDLDFESTQISDCAILSAEVSPAGAINLVNHCWTAVLNLLANGLLCRGYITRGRIIHQGIKIIGTGYQRAVDGEKGVSAFKKTAKEKGTPFVEVDRSVCDYVRDNGDECGRTMFGRYTKDTGDGVVLFPFQRISHKFAIGRGFPDFKPEEHLESNNNVRKWISTLKGRVMEFADPNNPAAMQKIEHYIRALDDQLIIADKVEEMIKNLGRPIGR